MSTVLLPVACPKVPPSSAFAITFIQGEQLCALRWDLLKMFNVLLFYLIKSPGCYFPQTTIVSGKCTIDYYITICYNRFDYLDWRYGLTSAGHIDCNGR